MAPNSALSLVCFAHLRWDFIFQRPQHIMTRFAKERLVYYVEEPLFSEISKPIMSCSKRENGLHVIVPLIPKDYSDEESIRAQKYLIREFLHARHESSFVSWYYTP